MQEQFKWLSDNEFFLLGLICMFSIISLYVKLPLLAIIFSTLFALYSISKIRKFDSVKNWIKCESILQSCETSKKLYSSRTMSYIYIADCIYTYTYNGQEYQGKDISLFARDSMMQDLNEHHQLMQKIKQTIIKRGVYVNPKNPEESVVFRDMSFKSAPIYWGGIILSAIFILIGFIQIIFF